MIRRPFAQQSLPDPGPFLNMTEEEYAAALRAWGYGEHAVEMELNQRREYLKTIAPPKPAPPTTEELLEGDDPYTRAVMRIRFGVGKSEKPADIEERPPTRRDNTDP